MTAQPKALRLVNNRHNAHTMAWQANVCTELRRLCEANQSMLDALEEARVKLEWFTDSYPTDLAVSTDVFFANIDAAIAKATK